MTPTWTTAVDDAGKTVLRCQHGDRPIGDACPICIATAIPDDDREEPGFYEAMTERANADGLPDRLTAERTLWDGYHRLIGIADELQEVADKLKLEKAGTAIARSRAWRSMIELRVKAINEAGKYARAASDLVLWRERWADNEKADRLYVERQRAVGRKREAH